MDKDGMCHVCGDKASGKHYGVPSCDGCRGFFKRSVRRNLEYACKEGGHCLIDVTRRNQCQACRFAKCLRVNMKKDAVQHERAPRTSNIPPVNELPHLSACVAWELTTVIPQNIAVRSSFFPYSVPNAVSQNISGVRLNDHSEISSDSRHYGNENEVSSSEEIRRENEKKTICAPFSTSYILSNDINECASRLLIFTVKWIKSIPSFLQLSEMDKKILLNETWNDLFILNAVQWSFLFYDSLAKCIYHSQNKQLIDYYRKLKDVIIRFQRLHVDYTEFACLKALTLFNSDTAKVRDRLLIEVLQDQTQMILHDYCSLRQNLRFGKLLLLLRHVSCFQSRATEELFFEEYSGRANCSVQNFILEILQQ